MHIPSKRLYRQNLDTQKGERGTVEEEEEQTYDGTVIICVLNSNMHYD